MNTVDSILVGVIIFLVWQMTCNRDGLVNKPEGKEKQQMIKQILQNEHLFENHVNLAKGLNQMPWLDAITFNDVKQLKRKNQLNEQTLDGVL